MIALPEGAALRVITQPDHAHFSGELLSLWRGDGLPSHPRRDDLVFAAREHDNGWREADAAPRWDAGRGRPHDFISLPREERIEIWERGTSRYAAARPYAALLITRHALNLFQDRRDEAGWASFVTFLTDLEQSLREETGTPRQELETDYRFLDLADQISLGTCNGWRGPIERYGWRIAFAEATVHLQPFPFAGATTFRVPCRRIPQRPYRGDADLGGELAAARWGELDLRVAPFG
ncbi:MAG TPA: DUF3891 family protein [Thermoanaerobaculia bacterium]|jgi:hypothetical protein